MGGTESMEALLCIQLEEIDPHTILGKSAKPPSDWSQSVAKMQWACEKLETFSNFCNATHQSHTAAE